MKRIMKSCKICKWALWQRTANGDIRVDANGNCNYPIVRLPNLPSCTQGDTHLSLNRRNGIWSANGEECPCYTVQKDTMKTTQICCLKCSKPIAGKIYRTTHWNALCWDCETVRALRNLRKRLDGSKPLDVAGAVMAIDLMIKKV